MNKDLIPGPPFSIKYQVLISVDPWPIGLLLYNPGILMTRKYPDYLAVFMLHGQLRKTPKGKESCNSEDTINRICVCTIRMEDLPVISSIVVDPMPTEDEWTKPSANFPLLMHNAAFTTWFVRLSVLAGLSIEASLLLRLSRLKAIASEQYEFLSQEYIWPPESMEELAHVSKLHYLL